jgi:hypothetical protein
LAFRALIAAVVSLAFVPPAPAARSTWDREARGARTALSRAVDAHYITVAVAGRYLAVLKRARTVSHSVPPGRADVLEHVLAQVAAPKSPTAPRAFQLYTTLAENADYLAAHPLPPDGTDVTGDDGAVYRYFSGIGLEFHPLANAAALNNLVAARDTAGASALVDALVARAVTSTNGGLVWEYQFTYDDQQPPWASGMAQAVLAQALARAGRLDLARAAWKAIPGVLDVTLPEGPWIRLYGKSGLLVLNAQLQTAISLADYAKLADDTAAADYANALLATAKAMLPKFDTGHWSRYSLLTDADLHYQDYVIGLLKTLSVRTGDQAWRDAADRFALYETQPPLLTAPTATPTIYPRPHDGVRDDLLVRFFLSKPSKVALVVDGEAVDGYRLQSGWHTFDWHATEKLAEGSHEVRLVAADLNGNPGSTDVGSFAVARDDTAPELSATKAKGRIHWRAKDGESSCCAIRIELSRPGGHKTLTPSIAHGLAAVPRGYWSATVIARDAAGNDASQRLGLVIGRARS